MSFLSRAFSGEPPEKRTFEGFASIPGPLEDFAMRGEHASAGNAMSLNVFYACVTLLADTIASLELTSYRKQGSARIAVDPQPTLFQGSPYPGLTWFDWLWMLMESLAVTGNGFGYVTAREGGRPTAILPVHPDQMQIQLQNDQKRDVSWTDPIYLINGQEVPANDIMHIKRYPLSGHGVGMSPIEKAAIPINLGLSAEKYGLRYFKDSANPSGILSSKDELTPQQVQQAAKSWITSHQGRRLPAVLGGGLTWQPITLTPSESQFIEVRKFQVEEITRLFRIPPHMVSNTEKSTSWGSGIEQQSIGFVTYTLRPWLTCIEQALTRLTPGNQFAKFDIDGLLRGDVKARWEAYGLGRNAGVYSTNDILAMEDRPPIGEEGDIRWQPMNFIPLGTPLSDYPGNQPKAPGEIAPS